MINLPAWTEQELNILRVSYENKIPPEVITQLIPGRTRRAIINQANKKGFSENNYFKPEEIEYIRTHYTGENLKELSETLNRTEQLICRKAKELGLTQMGRPSKNRSIANSKTASEKTKNYWASEKGVEKRKAAQEKKEAEKNKAKKYHAPEYREKVGKRVKEMWSNPNSKYNSEENRQRRSDNMMNRQHESIKENQSLGYSKGNGGTREDLGIYVRSRWEANYARYLNFLKDKKEIHDWQYEPDTFWFEHIKRGARSYTPDFKVWTSPDVYEYHEVKGYMDQKSKTKLDRMGRYYPEEKIIIIAEKEYKAVKQWSSLIPNWE